MSKKPTCMACGTPALPGQTNLVPCTQEIYLCRDCVSAMTQCFEARGSPAMKPADSPRIPTPAELAAALDRAVIGQTEAKRALAVAGWKHLQQLSGNTAVPPAHVLLFGPTGCGKSHLAKSLATLLDVPFAAVDATSFTETGYRGRDVRDIVLDILDSSDGDMERAKHAVVFVDEIDKLSASGSDARMAYSRGTQHAFLTLLEGATVTAEQKEKTVVFDPSGVLFLFAGAFPGLENILSERISRPVKRAIGFGGEHTAPTAPDSAALLRAAIPDDFVRYGITAELMGRIPVLAPILPLTEAELARVLVEPEGAVLARYKTFFGKLGVDFSIDPDVVTMLAHTAHASGSGARGLKGRLEKLITDAIFDMPKHGGVHITSANLAGKEAPHERATEDPGTPY